MAVLAAHANNPMKMNGKSMKWRDELKTLPRLSFEQIEAVKRVIDHHMSHLAFDFPAHDDAQWMVQRDLDSLSALGPSNTSNEPHPARLDSDSLPPIA